MCCRTRSRYSKCQCLSVHSVNDDHWQLWLAYATCWANGDCRYWGGTGKVRFGLLVRWGFVLGRDATEKELEKIAERVSSLCINNKALIIIEEMDADANADTELESGVPLLNFPFATLSKMFSSSFRLSCYFSDFIFHSVSKYILPFVRTSTLQHQ